MRVCVCLSFIALDSSFSFFPFSLPLPSIIHCSLFPSLISLPLFLSLSLQPLPGPSLFCLSSLIATNSFELLNVLFFSICIKVKHSQLRDVPVKVTGSKHLSYSHVFEISGPIIPHHTLNIAAVLQDYHSLQQGSSVVTYNTHLPSAALNTQAVNQPEKDLLAMNVHKLFVDFELANPGLLSSLKESMGSRPLLASGAFLKELKISQQGYLWS